MLRSFATRLVGRLNQSNPCTGRLIPLNPVTRRIDGHRIGRMQGEGMARHRRAVRRAVVREQAVEADQGAGRGFDQDGRAVVWPGCGCRAFSSKNSGENIAVDLLPLTP